MSSGPHHHLPPKRNKILRLANTECERALVREEMLINQIMHDEFEQSLFLWRCQQPTIVLPAGKKWVATQPLKDWLTAHDWQIMSRKTGGAPVPQTAGMVNISHLYLWPEKSDYSIKQAYLGLCSVLQTFFHQLGITTEIHATPGAYCDGDYNINIAGKKVTGTAQRLMVRKDGRKVVLAHACILVDDVISTIIPPVNACNRFNNMTETLSESVHTYLNAHLATTYNTDTLFSKIIAAFQAAIVPVPPYAEDKV